MTNIYGIEVEPKVGDLIRFDGNPIYRKLLPGDCPVDESYPGCRFCLDSVQVKAGIPVNIKVTGRTLKRYDARYWVRVVIEFVRDGEPNTFEKAWLLT